MEGLLSLLLFAGLFFVMMRFGCGAHMLHGHHNHGRQNKNKQRHADPVCGVEVDLEQGYGKMHDGKFEADPEQYLKSEHHHEGGSI